MQMRKNCTFSNILQKVKSYFLAISINLRVIPIEIPKKDKIEAPYCTSSLKSDHHIAKGLDWKVSVTTGSVLFKEKY
jgi:hypothetical protein